MTIKDCMEKYSFLREILCELTPEQLESISVRSYAAGETVLQRCEDNCDTFIVLSGVCCATCNLINGERGWFRKKTVGDVFGLLGALRQEHDFSSTIFAKTPSVLVRIPSVTVKQCFGIYPQFTREITLKVANRLNSALWQLSECNSYTPYAGLVTYLIYAYEFYLRDKPKGYSGAVHIPETQAEIAHFVCVNVRTLQRVLPEIRNEGLITMRSNRIYIDPRQYERLKARKAEYFR